MPEQSNAVVLLSGGLDSTTALAVARSEGFRLNALTFNYGQRHAGEVEAARRIGRQFRVARHEIAEIDLRVFGGSALTDKIPVPRNRFPAPDISAASAIPVTYVPARNTIFLAYALGFAEVTRSFSIFIGVNALDYSGYPDCRPEYIRAFEQLANLATKIAVEGTQRVEIRAPLLDMTKSDIIRLGTGLGVDYSMTSSCYDPGPGGEACGECDACRLRLKGFAAAGLSDPIRYATPGGPVAASAATMMDD